MDASFYVLLTFLAFVGVLVYYKIPQRVLGLLDSRSATIAKQLDDARAIRDEAKERLAEAKRQEESAEEQARAIITQSEQAAKARAEEIETAFTQRLERQQRQNEDKLKHLEAQLRARLRAESADLAIKLASEMLRDKMSDAQKTQLLQQSLGSLDERLSPPS